MSATVIGSGLGLLGGSAGLLGQGGRLGQAGVGVDGTRVNVNAATGNLVVQRSDDLLVGVGGASDLLRTYNSLGTWDGDNGDNWQMGLVQRVQLTGTVNTAGSTVVRTAADGSTFSYAWNATASAYTANEGGAEVDRLAWNATGSTWTWTDGASGATQTYDSAGRMVRAADRSGNRVEYTYTGSLLTQVKSINNTATPGSTQNETLTLVYDTTAGRTSNLLRVETRVDNGTGTASVLLTRVRYTYDASNRLESVTTDLSPTDNAVADNNSFVTLYTYDGSTKRITSITQMSGAVFANATNRANAYFHAARLEISYDASGRVYQLKQNTGATSAGVATQSITTYTYGTNVTTVTDGTGAATVLGFDAARRLTLVTLPDGRTHSFAYVSASDNHLASVTDERGRTTTYGYDAAGNRVLERDAAGNTVKRVFDAGNQLLASTRYTVADPDGAGAALPGGGLTSRSVYDATRRLVYSLDAEGRVTRYERNALGQITAEVLYRKDRFDLSTFNENTAPTQAQLDAWVAALVDKTQARRTETAYDWRGNVARVTTYGASDATGAGVAASAMVTEHVYDQAGLLRQTIDHRGAAKDTAGKYLNNYYINFSYDGLGRLTLSGNTLNNNSSTIEQYVQNVYNDAVGSGTAVQTLRLRYDSATNTYPVVAARDLVFHDLAGRVQKRQQTSANGTTLLTQTVNTYDAEGRLLKSSESLAGGGTADTLHVYDAAGRRVATVDAEGYFTLLEYTKTDRLARSTRMATRVDATALANARANASLATVALLKPAANAAADQVSYQAWDAADRLVRSVDAEGGVTEYGYDGAGRLVQTVQRATLLSATQRTNLAAKDLNLAPADADLAAAADAARDRSVRHFFDAGDRLLGTLDAEGYLTEHRYDAAGQRTETIAWATATNATLRASGTLAALRPAAAVAQDQHTWFLYDSAGRQTGVVDAEGYLTETQYDGSGNAVATIRYKARVAGAGAATLPTALSGATGATGVTVASLRPNGASTAAGDRVTLRIFNGMGWLMLEQLTDGTQAKHATNTYTYDYAGRVLQVTRSSEDASAQRKTNFLYDALGRVAAELDGMGSALLATVSAATVGTGMTYATQADKDAAITSVWNSYATQHAYDGRGLRVATRDAAGNRILYYYDNRGQLTHTVNALGEVTVQSRDAFGRVTQTTQVLKRISAAVLATLTGGQSSAILGTVTPLLSAGDAISSNAYDRQGRLTQTTDALGLQTRSSYSAFGETTGQTRQLDATQWVHEAHTRDRRGLLVQTAGDDKTTDTAGALTTTAGLNRTRSTSYDAFGRAVGSVDGRGVARTAAYDRLGREVSVSNGLGQLASASYDFMGRVLTQTDRQGGVTTFAYNDATRTMTVTSPEGVVTTTVSNRHGDVLTVADGLGRVTSYTYNADGKLVDTRNGLGTVVDHNEYDSAGRLSWETDALGRKVAYTYDALGRVLTRAVDPAGLNLVSQTVYRAGTREVWTSDATGIWTRSSFDKAGQLTSVTVDATRSIADSTALGLPATAYTGLNLSTATAYDGEGRVLTVTDANGVVTRYEYDALGRRTRETVNHGVNGVPVGSTYLNLLTQYVYDRNDNVGARIDPLGRITRYTYDAENRLTYTIDPLNFVSEVQYDKEGRVTRTVRYATAIAAPATWDNAGVAAKLVAAAGDITAFNRYDRAGRLAIAVDGAGYAVENFYNAAGQVNRQVRYATALTPAQKTDIANLIPSGATALAGQWKLTAAGGDISEYLKFDGAGREIARLDGEGYVTENTLDGAGQVTRTVRYATAVALANRASDTPGLWRPAAVAADAAANYKYDSAGRRILAVDAEGYVDETGYDAAGRATRTVRYATRLTGPQLADLGNLVPSGVTPAGAQWKVAAAIADVTRYTKYDAAGRAVARIDGEGYLVETLYDAVGQATKIIAYATAVAAASRASDLPATWRPTANSADASSVHTYDAAGRLIDSTDAAGFVTHRVYDAAGRETDTTRAWGTAQAATTHRVFNAAGHQVEETQGFGSASAVTRRFTVDAQGWRVRSVDPRGVELADRDTSWALARRKALGTIAGVTLLDASGNAKLAAALTAAQKLALEDLYATRQTFDALGRRTVLTDASGATVQTQYDAFGNAVKLTDQRGNAGHFYFDKLGRQTLYVDPEGYVTQTAYNALGQKTSVRQFAARVSGTVVAGTAPTLPAANAALDMLTSTSSDKLGRVLSTTTQLSSSTSSVDAATWDAFGNRSTATNAVAGVTSYEYDHNGRMTRETLPVTSKNASGTQVAVVNTFSYDARGNLLTRTEALGLPEQRVTSYVFDKLDRLVTTRGAAVTTVTFDAAGTATTTTGVQPTETRSFDGRGNLIETRDANGQRTLYFYDVLDRKVAELSATGALTVRAHDAAGNVVLERRYGDAVALPATAGGTAPTPVNAANVRETQYVYDAASRRVETRVPAVQLGRYNANTSAYEFSTADVVTRTTYDAAGNEVLVQDANGGLTYAYFDKLGRKVAQVDAGRYLSTWSYADGSGLRAANGAVIKQVRYAVQIPASFALGTGSLMSDLQTQAGGEASAANRTTQFAYDLKGRVLTQTVLNVAFGSVDAAGLVSTGTASAVTSYQYDGLDNVVQKTDANGGVSHWEFDKLGRETRHQGQAFVDFEGSTVRPTERSTYNGLGLVIERTQEGKLLTTATGADDRVTTYTYGAGGRLASKTDAAGVVTTYSYDAAGRRTQSTFARSDATGAAATAVTVQTRYDAAGREVWSRDAGTGTVTEVRYNLYGEVTGKRLNSGGPLGEFQEWAVYNALGKVFMTNTGSGGARAYFYDAMGNATLLVESGSVDIKPFNQAQLISAMGATSGNYSQTISVYDARNQLTDTFQPTLFDTRETVAMSQFISQQPGSAYAGGAISPAAASVASTRPGYAVTAAGTVSGHGTQTISATANRVTGTDSLITEGAHYYYSSSFFGGNETVYVPAKYGNFGFTRLASVTVNVPTVLPATGDVVAEYTINGTTVTSAATAAGGNITLNAPANVRLQTYQYSSSTYYSHQPGKDGGTAYYAYHYSQVTTPNPTQMAVSLYQIVPGGGRVLVGGTNVNVWGNGSNTVAPEIGFKNQPASATGLHLYFRAAGSTGAYTAYNLPQAKNTANALIPGLFRVSGSSFANGNYEGFYVAFDSTGKAVNRETVSFSVNNSTGTASITQGPTAPTLGGNGRAFFTNQGAGYESVLNLAETGTDVTKFKVYFKLKTATAWSAFTSDMPATTGRPGWMGINLPPATLAAGFYDFWIEAKNSAGTVVNNLLMDVSLAGTASNVSNYRAYQNQASNVTFTQAATARTLNVWIRPLGSTGGYATAQLTSTTGVFTWNASAYAPVPATTNLDYEYLYSTLDANGVVLNQAHGTLRLGANAATLTHVNDTQPTGILFQPPTTVAAAPKMVLNYRVKGSSAAFTTVNLTADANGRFPWNTSTLSNGDYEYSYELRNASGVLATTLNGKPAIVSGTLHIGPEAPAAQVDWVMTVAATNSSAVIHRQQKFNAFGDVIQETDGNGNQTNFSYSNLGLMTKKSAPVTNMTLANGQVKRHSPVTDYLYDKTGRVIATTTYQYNNSDVAVGLTTRANLLAWEQAEGEEGTARILNEYHPDSGVARKGFDIFGDLRQATDEIGRRTDFTYDKRGLLTRIDRPTRAAGTPGNTTGVAFRPFETYVYDAAGNRIQHTDAMGQSERMFYDSLGRVTVARSFLGFDTSYAYAYLNTIKGAGGAQVGGWRKTTTQVDGKTLIDDQSYFGQTTWHQDLGGHQTTYGFNWANWLIKQTSTANQNIDYAYFANGYIKSVTDNTLDKLARYGYDKEGNRTFEAYSTKAKLANGQYQTYYEMSEVSYDELNRVVKVVDPKAEIRYEYDAVGNRRRVWSYYHDGINGASKLQDLWYAYDSMNRFVVSMGGGVDVNGGVTGGLQITYDLAGQRTSVYGASNYLGGGTEVHTETYTYTGDGFLEDTRIDGVLRARRANDKNGRVAAYTEYSAAGAQTLSRSTTFDADSRVTQEVSSTGGTTTYSYGADNRQQLQSTTNVNGGVTLKTDYTYALWDEAKVATIKATPLATGVQGWAAGASDMSYDVNGHLAKAIDRNQNRQTVYVTDAYGQVLTRDELAANGTVDKHQVYYYLNENRIGDVGNDGPSRVSYAELLARRDQDANAKHGDFRYGKAVASADFDQNYEPISPTYPAAVAAVYTVRSGDTLQSIARNVWGDGAMWYLIADANGLGAGAVLTAGQRLAIPNKVTNIHNNAAVFRPYDAGEAIGDLLPVVPDAPPPPPPKVETETRSTHSGGCGGFAKMLISVVTIAVAAVVTMGASALLTPAIAAGAGAVGSAAVAVTSGAIGAAVGNAVGQGLNLAAGLQDDFSWGAVGMAAAAGGLASGVAQSLKAIAGNVSSPLGKIGFSMLKGAIGNTASQGLGLVTGLQRKFDWMGVASAMVGAGLGQAMDQLGETDTFSFLKNKEQPHFSWDAALGNTARAALRGGLGDIATQGLGLALGTRRRFEWTQVATAAGQAGLKQAFEKEAPWSDAKAIAPTGDFGLGTRLGNIFTHAAAAGLNNALGQGLALATGTQRMFKWQEVAVAAGGAGIDRLLNKELPGLSDPAASPFKAVQYTNDHEPAAFAGLRSLARAGLGDLAKQGLATLVGKQPGVLWQNTLSSLVDASIKFGADRLEKSLVDASATPFKYSGSSNLDKMLEASFTLAPSGEAGERVFGALSLTQKYGAGSLYSLIPDYQAEGGDDYLVWSDFPVMGRRPGFNLFGMVAQREDKDLSESEQLTKDMGKLFSGALTNLLQQGAKVALGLQKDYDVAAFLKAASGGAQGLVDAKFDKAFEDIRKAGQPRIEGYTSFNLREVLTGEARHFGYEQLNPREDRKPGAVSKLGTWGGWELEQMERLRFTADDFKTAQMPWLFVGGQ